MTFSTERLREMATSPIGDIRNLATELLAAREMADHRAACRAGHPAMCCGQCEDLIDAALARAEKAEAALAKARGERTGMVCALLDVCVWVCDAQSKPLCECDVSSLISNMKRSLSGNDEVLESIGDAERLHARDAKGAE